MHSFGLDQQGGKGNASFTREVAPTILHDSHGTPHAVAQTGCFIPGNSAKARSIGYSEEVAITIGTMGGNGTKPAICQRNIAYNIQTCDGGTHRRKDRPHGGFYVAEAQTSLALTVANPTTSTVVVSPCSP